ncbi:YbaN family protein [Celeribacter halophilus]|uniref:YbaN family protein n=1 Tax=Celeribacter halophilus TaxID=576117 RepID=UPI003A92DC1A
MQPSRMWQGMEMTDRIVKLIHLTLGTLCVILGFIGAFLPVMPTTIFVILAAFFFTKGSPRLRSYLLEHRIFGPNIRAWEETGAIPRRIKVVSISMMLLSFVPTLLLRVPPLYLGLQAVLIGAGAAYILSRPDA